MAKQANIGDQLHGQRVRERFPPIATIAIALVVAPVLRIYHIDRCMTAEIVPLPPHLSKRAALSIIRSVATDSNRIGWSQHARMKMEAKSITMRQALDTLRNGKLHKGPELDDHGEWSVTLRKRSAGRDTGVAVAIKKGSQDLTVVTVY